MALVKLKDNFFVEDHGILSIKPAQSSRNDNPSTEIRYTNGGSVIVYDMSPAQVMSRLNRLPRSFRFRR